MNTYDKVMTAVLAVCGLPVVAVFLAGLWGYATFGTFWRTAVTASVVLLVAAVTAGARWPSNHR